MWENFSATAKLTPEQETHLKKAFYAGALELFLSLQQTLIENTKEEYKDYHRALTKEFADFWMHLMMDHLTKKN